MIGESRSQITNERACRCSSGICFSSARSLRRRLAFVIGVVAIRVECAKALMV
jgi:hypothetical protein